ncbi:MAG: helix-turn-helix transcriptional regulator [Bacillota bacterium]
MKLERMLSIITYLMNHEKAKANDLAQKLEVSVRTIYRDIDAIAQAGIPVTTYQGADGGIGIVEGFRLDNSILTGGEVVDIVTALKGLHSISRDEKTRLLIDKISGIAGKTEYLPTGNEILIDLSPWNKDDQLGRRIQEIKKAIRERRRIAFTYCSYEKCTERTVEPCVIVFKDSNWYLYAYCLLREDFRLFKLRRMRSVKTTDTVFAKREFTLDRVEWDDASETGIVAIVAAFDRSMEYALADIFGMDNPCEPTEDGRLKVTFHMQPGGWLYGFLLGFGDKVEVLEPDALRRGIQSMAENICKLYDNQTNDI